MAGESFANIYFKCIYLLREQYFVFVLAGPSAEDLWKMREAIAKATSLEEIERLNRLLQAGQIPGKKSSNASSNNGKFCIYIFLNFVQQP